MAISTTTVVLETEIKDRLQRIAESQHKPAETLMQDAIAEYVDRQEKREQFRQETVAALDEFKRTGLHATGEEVDEWLTKTATGEKVPFPKCHL
jgi:predicted transcriptional regulator